MVNRISVKVEDTSPDVTDGRSPTTSLNRSVAKTDLDDSNDQPDVGTVRKHFKKEYKVTDSFIEVSVLNFTHSKLY